MCVGPQTTGPALPDPLMRHWAFLGPSEQGAMTDKPQAPGSQPTGWRPSHTACGHLATPCASAVWDRPTHEQMEMVTGNAGALPESALHVLLRPSPQDAWPLWCLSPRLYSSL